MRKLEEVPEADSAYFTRCTSRFVLNIIAVLADCCSLSLAIIFFHMSPLVLYLGLLASFISLRFTCSFILRFHLAAILLVNLPPQGNAYCGMKIPVGPLVLVFLSLLLLSMAVVIGVDVVPLPDVWALVHSEQLV